MNTSKPKLAALMHSVCRGAITANGKILAKAGIRSTTTDVSTKV